MTIFLLVLKRKLSFIRGIYQYLPRTQQHYKVDAGNVRVPCRSRKTLFSSKYFTCVHGDGGCGNTIPGDVAETRGFLP